MECFIDDLKAYTLTVRSKYIVGYFAGGREGEGVRGRGEREGGRGEREGGRGRGKGGTEGGGEGREGGRERE